jgi:hypothetical protein
MSDLSCLIKRINVTVLVIDLTIKIAVFPLSGKTIPLRNISNRKQYRLRTL